MVPNAPKWKETHQNMTSDSNGVDRERLLRKFLTTHRGTNFCINCTSLACFCSKFCAIAKRFQMHPNGKKTHQNMSLGSNGVDRERSFWKFLQDIVAQTFALIAPVWRVLQQVLCNSEKVPNAPKRKETHQNMSFRVQWYGSGAFVPKNSNKTSLHKLLH